MKRNLVISTKVTPEEKAEFTMIAQKNGIWQNDSSTDMHTI